MTMSIEWVLLGVSIAFFMIVFCWILAKVNSDTEAKESAIKYLELQKKQRDGGQE